MPLKPVAIHRRMLVAPVKWDGGEWEIRYTSLTMGDIRQAERNGDVLARVLRERIVEHNFADEAGEPLVDIPAVPAKPADPETGAPATPGVPEITWLDQLPGELVGAVFQAILDRMGK